MSSNPPTSPSNSVRVCVRVRPLNAREKAAAAEFKSSWNISNTTITQCLSGKPIAANSFAFDHVFEQHINNEQVYTALAKPVVTSATDGINGVIFAYGQTAAGKTYTMLGSENNPGVTRRSISEVFRLIAACGNRKFLLRASYIEIYNEIIRDLLVPANDNLKIHEDVINKRVFVDSREEVVTSVGQVMDIIARGETTRAVGETNMNDRSSRSHTIFSLKIQSREISAEEADGDEAAADDGMAVRASTLSLVDLAGSERASFTKAQGMRLVEGGHINKSLLTLGNVINKLSSGDAGTMAHIPYRDSKLTRLLQPALGGNARTAIVCAVTPAILHMEESLSTLKFASRAKKVTNHATTNVVLDDRAKLRRAEKEIKALKEEMNRLRSGDGNDGGSNILEVYSTTGSKNSLDERLRVFSKKFDQILKTINDSGAGLKRKNVSSNEWPRAQSTSLASALVDLTPCGLNNAISASTIDTTQAEMELRKKVLAAEKRAVVAERRERQAVVEINYERQAMIAEVEALVATSEEAEEARRAAERECVAANRAVGNKLMGSFVDELVTEVMVKSEMKMEVCQARAEATRLGEVNALYEGLKETHGKLKKDHLEVLKREKRGVGPVMKEVRFLQGKLVDAEKKCKVARQTSSKSGSEKAAVERKLKEKVRAIKSLTAEVDRLRNHSNKGQSRVTKEIAEEKRQFESCEKELRAEIERLKVKVGEEEDSVKEMAENIGMLEVKAKEAEERSEELDSEKEELRKEISSLKEQTSATEMAKSGLEIEVEQLKKSAEDHDRWMMKVSEELGKSHLEAEEYKAEESAIRDQLKKMEAEKEVQEKNIVKMEGALGELKEKICGLEREVEQERERSGNAERRVGELEKRMKVELGKNQTFEGLEGDLESERAGKKEVERLVRDLEGKLKQIRIGKQEAEGEVNNLKEMLESARIAKEGAEGLVGDAEQRYIRKEREVGELVKKVGQYEKEIGEARIELERWLVRDLEGKLKQDRVGKQEAEGEVNNLKEILESARVAKGAEGLVGDAEQRYIRKEREVGELVKKVDQYEKEIGEARLEVKRLKGEVEKFEAGGKRREGDGWVEVENLLVETATRTREIMKLTARNRSKDHQIHDLHEKLGELERGEGMIGRLEQRVHRRDLMIGELNRRLEILKEKDVDTGMKKLLNLEGRIAALMKQVESLEARITKLVTENECWKEENWKLREHIKEGDLKRVQDAARRKENRLEEVRRHRRHQQPLKKLDTISTVPRSPDTTSEVIN